MKGILQDHTSIPIQQPNRFTALEGTEGMEDTSFNTSNHPSLGPIDNPDWSPKAEALAARNEGKKTLHFDRMLKYPR